MAEQQINERALETHVLRQFRVIFRSVRQHFAQVERTAGITGSQLWALHAIASHPSLRVTGLARLMAIHQSTASNLVEKLVGLGYVQRQRAEADSRVVCLQLTEAGQRQLARAPGPARGLLPEALQQLPDEHLLQLHAALGLLMDQMQLNPGQGGDTPLSDL